MKLYEPTAQTGATSRLLLRALMAAFVLKMAGEFGAEKLNRTLHYHYTENPGDIIRQSDFKYSTRSWLSWDVSPKLKREL